MKLLYIADPMCSWCYGFGAVLGELLADPPGPQPLSLELVMGGLRPYTTEPMAPARADEIHGHWLRVAQVSGLPFAPQPHPQLHRAGFVYDTEPASRAVVTVRSLWPERAWDHLKRLQHAFYAEGRDVTRAEVLTALASESGLPEAEFRGALESDEMRDLTRSDFRQVQAWGVGSFPALVAEVGGELMLVAQGHLPIETLRQALARVRSPQAVAS